jgi:hypothetical protein
MHTRITNPFLNTLIGVSLTQHPGITVTLVDEYPGVVSSDSAFKDFT